MDLQFKEVAELLRVSECTLQRWIDEGSLPSYRLNDQYRFNRTEIEDWLLRQRVACDPDHAEYEGVPGDLQFGLFRALHRGLVLNAVPARSKQELIALCMKEMACRFDFDAEVLTDLFMDREKMMSTGLGHGIAIPHTRDFLLNTHFDVVLVVYPEHPLDYESLDGQPVHTCFFLFACDDRRHLNLLSKIAHLSSSEKACKFLQQKPQKDQLLTYLKTWESHLVSHRSDIHTLCS